MKQQLAALLAGADLDGRAEPLGELFLEARQVPVGPAPPTHPGWCFT